MALAFVGCSKPSVDPGPAPLPSANTKLFIKFTHNVDGVTLDPSDTIIYENLPGNIYSVKSLKYLISNVRLNNFLYENYEINEYHLVDVKDDKTLIWEVSDSIKYGDYASVSLFVGFLDDQNKTGEHSDLDNDGFGWSPQRGGGYYTLQMEGRFYENNFDIIPDPYDLGLGAKKLVVTQTDSTYEPNEIITSLHNSGFSLPRGTKIVTIEIQMNLNKLFESNNLPNFDLKDNYTGLEDNASGSSLLSNNIKDAFKMGGVTYNTIPK